MKFRSFLCSALLLCVLHPSMAQTYRCTIDGRLVISDRPCVSNGDSRLGGMGPTESARMVRGTPMPTTSMPKAEDHLKYLSSGCASIREAIRTGPARGVHWDVIQGLQEEYRDKCSVEDAQARKQASQDRADQQRVQLAQLDAAAAQRRSANDRAERCKAMRDVIGLKRHREATLNAKEVESLRTLEKTYDATCIAR